MSRGRFRLPDIHVGARVVDIGPALALAAFLVFVTPVAARATTGARSLDGLGFVLVGVSALPLTLWRRSPVVAFSGSLAFAGLYLAMGYPTGPVILAPLAGLLAGLVRERATVRAVAVASGGIGLPLAQGVGSGWTWGLVLFGLAWLVVAGLFAGAVRARRGYLAEVDAHTSWAARTREEEGRRRAAEERLRLARDMHDAIGHSLAVISFQAGVAEHLLERSPDDVRHALGAIRTVSKQALDELRTELGQLRTEGVAASAPATGLEMLPELIGTMRDAGMAASLEMDGITSTVPAVVGAPPTGSSRSRSPTSPATPAPAPRRGCT